MWGCNFGPLIGGWWGGGLWSILLLILAILLVVYLAGLLFGGKTPGRQEHSRDRLDSEAILKARFARGEIDEEEYHKLKRILAQP